MLPTTVPPTHYHSHAISGHRTRIFVTLVISKCWNGKKETARGTKIANSWHACNKPSSQVKFRILDLRYGPWHIIYIDCNDFDRVTITTNVCPHEENWSVQLSQFMASVSQKCVVLRLFHDSECVMHSLSRHLTKENRRLGYSDPFTARGNDGIGTSTFRGWWILHVQ